MVLVSISCRLSVVRGSDKLRFAVNLAILGGTGYASYIHWDKPTWDRRIVSAVSAAILTVWGAEGYVVLFHLSLPS